MEIHLGGLDAFVSKPKGNEGDLGPDSEEPHGAGVSEHVWGHVRGGQ